MLWPLAMLNASIAKANRRIIRWAIRNRNRFAYLFAIFWVPVTIGGLLAWVLVAVPIKVDGSTFMSVAMVVILVIKKILVAILYLMEEAMRTWPRLDHYRREFSEPLRHKDED